MRTHVVSEEVIKSICKCSNLTGSIKLQNFGRTNFMDVRLITFLKRLFEVMKFC